MVRHRTCPEHDVRHPADAQMRMLTGSGQQVRGLGCGQVVQHHQDPDRGRYPLMTGQHQGGVPGRGLQLADPCGEAFMLHQRRGVVDQQPK